MLYVCLINFFGGVGVQYSLIIKDFGFNTLQTTLLNIPQGVVQIFVTTLGMWLLHKYPVGRFFLTSVQILISIFPDRTHEPGSP